MEESAERSAEIEEAVEAVDDEPAPKEEVPAEPAAETEPEVVADTEADVPPAPPTEAPPVASEDEWMLPPRKVREGDGGGPSADDEPRLKLKSNRPPPQWPPRWRTGQPRREMEPSTATARATGPETARARSRPWSAPVPRCHRGDARGGADAASAHGGQGQGHPDGQGRANGQGHTWPHLMLMEFGAAAGDHRPGGDHVCGHPLTAARPGQLQRRRRTRRRRRGTSSASRSCSRYFDPRSQG